MRTTRREQVAFYFCGGGAAAGRPAGHGAASVMAG